MRVGSRVRMAREAAGIAQRELAGRAGIAHDKVSKIEQGYTAKPLFADIAAIARALGRSCDDFVPDAAAEPPAQRRGRPRSGAGTTPPDDASKPAAEGKRA